MELTDEDGGLALRILEQDAALENHTETDERDPTTRLLQTLRLADAPMTGEQLRVATRMRTQTLGQLLRQLVDQGAVRRTGQGYESTPDSDADPSSSLFPSRPP